MAVVEVENLVKNYGRIPALKGISLQVAKGEIFGLLGPNGAGKTTMIKILLGITKPTSGHARLLDRPAGVSAVRKHVGYLPEDHHFPEYHTADSLLRFYGALLEMPANRLKQRTSEVLTLVGLAARRKSKIRGYSKGMKQRLGIAQALFHNPDVLFLDEPTDGVDPVGRREIRTMLQELKNQGVTVFVNSHLLGEIELLCDRVVVVHRGSVLTEGTIPEVTQKFGVHAIGLAPNETLPIADVEALGFRVRPEAGRWIVEAPTENPIDPLVDLIHEKGLHLRHLAEKQETLEEAFLRIIRTADEDAAAAVQHKAPAQPEGGTVS